MHKRLQRLTHTNIHISPEEEGPQGLLSHMCGKQRQKSEKGQKIATTQQEDSQVKDCSCCNWQEMVPASWWRAHGVSDLPLCSDTARKGGAKTQSWLSTTSAWRLSPMRQTQLNLPQRSAWASWIKEADNTNNNNKKSPFTNHKMSNLPYQEPPGRRSITPSVMYVKDDKQERQNKHGRIEMSPWYQ